MYSFQYEGGLKFAIAKEELAVHLGGESGLIGKQLKVSVAVEDWRFSKTYSGFSTTRVFSDDILLKFLGGHVWTFKPNMPFKIYVSKYKLLHAYYTSMI